MKKAILLSSAHKSGSTWTGKVLAASSEVGYHHEPFNLVHSRYWKIPLQYQFEAVHKAAARESKIKAYLKVFFGGSPINLLRISRNLKGAFRALKIGIENWSHDRLLIKDPLALFSVEWISQTFDCDVVLLTRHPAAFVHSVMNENWTHDFRHFTEQKALREFLNPFQTELKGQENTTDPIGNAILTWKIIHSRIAQYQVNKSEWHFARFEDLLRDPEVEFGKIAERFSLDFDGMRRYIQKTIKPDRRDRWMDELPEDVIRFVFEQTKSLSSRWYQPEDWLVNSKK